MHQTHLLMGMPITITLADDNASNSDFDAAYDYFNWVDHTFSPFKPDSELSRFNRGELKARDWSPALAHIWDISRLTHRQTAGYFQDINPQGKWDPTGVVKGWSVEQASLLLKQRGCNNFVINAGGDAQVVGYKSPGELWPVAIRNPFNHEQIVKTLLLTDSAIATSGTSARGQHIQNPFHPNHPLTEIVSLTVLAPHLTDADRLATAAFAMGTRGIHFLATNTPFAAYQIDARGLATYTPNFERYVA